MALMNLQAETQMMICVGFGRGNRKEPHLPLGMDNSHMQEGNPELRGTPSPGPGKATPIPSKLTSAPTLYVIRSSTDCAWLTQLFTLIMITS